MNGKEKPLEALDTLDFLQIARHRYTITLYFIPQRVGRIKTA